jgi:hypothetical protein
MSLFQCCSKEEDDFLPLAPSSSVPSLESVLSSRLPASVNPNMLFSLTPEGRDALSRILSHLRNIDRTDDNVDVANAPLVLFLKQYDTTFKSFEALHGSVDALRDGGMVLRKHEGRPMEEWLKKLSSDLLKLDKGQ